ncbi:MAG: hypothetical protein GX297_09665, partial [Treponema sp.]|nr:hypothetical protein [Treponema sp.]
MKKNGFGFKKSVFVLMFMLVMGSAFVHAKNFSLPGGRSFSISKSGMSYSNPSNPSKNWTIPFKSGGSLTKNNNGDSHGGQINNDGNKTKEFSPFDLTDILTKCLSKVSLNNSAHKGSLK